MDRDFERDDRRRRYRLDDDPRDDPRERYGNEEDPWSREYRRAYAEGDLPRRMQNDEPYNRPGYEPEVGRPGGRENVDLERGDPYRSYRERYGGQRHEPDWQPRGRRPSYDRGDDQAYDRGGPRRDDAWQGGYYGQGRRWSGERFEEGFDHHTGPARRYGQPSYGRSASSYGSSPYGSSPYSEGDVGAWYGGDTGMGDPGSSQYGQPGSPYGQQRFGASDPTGRSGFGGRGSFSGRGPRGYQRSDERIREEVCEALTRHHDIDAGEMEVDVRGGTVILRGTADSGRTRRLAEEVVEEVAGVHDVQNELRVNRQRGYDDRSRASDRERGYDDRSSGAMVDTGTFASDRGGLRESGTPAYGVGVASTSGVSTRSGPGEPGLSAGAGASQHGNRWQIRETMDVVGSDGEKIGTVKAVHGTDFHVDRSLGRDVFVPFSAVRTVDGERVMLTVRANEVDDQHWPTPDLTGSNEGPVVR